MLSAMRKCAAGAGIALAACGGGGGGGGTERTLTPYTVSVTVSGLNGTVVLQNNLGNNLSVSANVSATFSATLIAGATYSVTVFTQPGGQTCVVGNASGTMPAANVSNVTVACSLNAPVLATAPGVKQVHLSWTANPAATSYRVLENPDGSGFAQLGADFTSPTTTIDLSNLLLSRRVNASYKVQSCNSFGCADSTPLSLLSVLTQMIGYFKQSNTQAGDGFGVSLALSADGSTLAVGAKNESSALAGVIAGAVNEGTAGNGAPSSGAVYVFTRTGAAWSQQAYVKASNPGGGDSFGYSLALSADGNTLAVGATFESSALTGVTAGAINEATAGNGANSSGAVYVFSRSGGTWSQQAYVKASNTGVGDYFGWSVSLSADGSTLAAAAIREASAATGINNTVPGQGDDSAFLAGAAYVFIRSGTNWSQQAYIKASNAEAFDEFGWSLALSGDGNTLAVGAIAESGALTGVTAGAVNEATAGNGAGNSGVVYVFLRTGSTWAQQAYVKASNAGAGDAFGYSVALNGDGNTLAVGAAFEASALTGVTAGAVSEIATGNAAQSSGAVYVFTRSGTAWSQQAYVKTSNPEGPANTGFADNFGVSVALSSDGNTLAGGAPGESSALTGIKGGAVNEATAGNGAVSSGAVYVFTRSGTTWTQHAYVKASNTEASDHFGNVVALSGDGSTLGVTATDEDSLATGIDGDQTDNSAGVAAASTGAVYLY